MNIKLNDHHFDPQDRMQGETGKTSRNQLITISDSESSPKVQEKIILKVRPTIFKSCIIFDIYVLPELSHVIQERLYGRTLPYGLICSLTVG